MSDALFSVRFLSRILTYKCKNILQDVSIFQKLTQIDIFVRSPGSANAQKDTSNLLFSCVCFLYVCFLDKSTLSKLKFLIVYTLSLIYLNNAGIRKV